MPIVCENVEYKGNAPATSFLDIQSELKDRLPESLDFREVIQGIRQYEGPWQAGYPGINAYVLANPVFNRQGDLLFELRPHGQWDAAPVPSPRNKHTLDIPKDTGAEHQMDGKSSTTDMAQKSQKSEVEIGTSSEEEGGLES